MEEILHLTSLGFPLYTSKITFGFFTVFQPTCLTSVWSHEFCFCLGIPGHFWKSKDQSLTRATSREVTHPVLMESGKDLTTDTLSTCNCSTRRSPESKYMLCILICIHCYIHFLYIYIYIYNYIHTYTQIIYIYIYVYTTASFKVSHH